MSIATEILREENWFSSLLVEFAYLFIFQRLWPAVLHKIYFWVAPGVAARVGFPAPPVCSLSVVKKFVG